ncbi:MAG: DUF1801 domain-containing protein [Chitinophagaceae bacterium]|nr:MAG: DUF1801 domain-containing protein [Chitinophagaceae bacterium]
MDSDIAAYNDRQSPADALICKHLAFLIDSQMPDAESKLWHAHPVWFLDGNPIVGYSKRKDAVRLLFWSGQSFDEHELKPEGSFKAAEKRVTDVSEIDDADTNNWLEKARNVQWDYKNLVKRKGRLDRLK